MSDKPDALHAKNYEAFETIDAMFFSGDITEDKKVYEFICGMLVRWQNHIDEIEFDGFKTFENNDEDDDD